MKKVFIVSIAASFFIAGCNNNSKKETRQESSTGDTVTSVDNKTDSLLKQKSTADSLRLVHRKDSILLRLTESILTALKNKNYSAFANYIHPVEGVRFSPYAYIDTVKNVRFTKRSFTREANSAGADMILWGEFDGTGDPIKMTLNNYMRRFVYDVDFVKPEKRSVNKFISGGNSLNNLLDIYKHCDFTESHFSGFEEKYAGQDWKTLRLVFKERNKKYYLVGVVHDEWTI
jgi:hypothetical protein